MGAVAPGAPPLPASPPPVAIGTLATAHMAGATQIFVELEKLPGHKPKHFRSSKLAKLQFPPSRELYSLSAKPSYWQPAPPGIDHRLVRQPVPDGVNPAHALTQDKRSAVWFGLTIRALGDELFGHVGRRIDVSTIELEFDLPSRLSHIEWSDENGAHEASIDLGDGKVKNWPYLHCVVTIVPLSGASHVLPADKCARFRFLTSRNGS